MGWSAEPASRTGISTWWPGHVAVLSLLQMAPNPAHMGWASAEPPSRPAPPSHPTGKAHTQHLAGVPVLGREGKDLPGHAGTPASAEPEPKAK